MTLRSAFVLLALTACRAAAPAREPAPAPEPARAPEPAPAAAPNHVTLLFSASTAGQLVPCGCSPDQRGGLPHGVALVDKLRKEDPNLLYIDAGDLLFESPNPPAKQLLTQRQMKARTLGQGDALLKAALRAVGQRDLALGPQFNAEASFGVPLLDEKRPTLLAQAGGVKVGILVAGSESEISARTKELRDQGARIVVLLLHPRGDNAFTIAQSLQPAARKAGVDLIVLGRRDDPSTDINRKDPGPPALLAVEGHGQSLLRVDIHLGDGPLQLAPSADEHDEELKALDARIDRFKQQLEASPSRKAQLEGKIKELQDRRAALASAPVTKPAPGSRWAEIAFLPITPKAGNDEAAQKLVDAYDQKVTELNLAEAQTQPETCPPAAKGELKYVGAAACVECHQDAVDFWKQTRHSHAYETLVGVKKQYSLDCIQCHVTGWQQPGGVCRIDKTQVGDKGIDGHGAGRQDVQCEACHGPGSAHLDDPTGNIKAKVPSTWCMRCHEPANSPRFDDAKYRPFIVGPGHGEKLPKGQKAKPREGFPE